MNFVELLYVILIYHISGNTKPSREAQDIIKESFTKSSELLTMTPYLGDVLTAIKAGESVDLNALSIALIELVNEYSVKPNAHASFAEVLTQFAKWFKNQNASSHKYLCKIVIIVRI